MKLSRFSFEDPSGLGISGDVPLPGLTVLFGPNGVGKTRVLENLVALCAPLEKWAGRQPEEGDRIDAFGHIEIALDHLDDDDDGPGADWIWLATQISRSRADLGMQAAVDVFNGLCDADDDLPPHGYFARAYASALAADAGAPRAGRFRCARETGTSPSSRSSPGVS